MPKINQKEYEGEEAEVKNIEWLKEEVINQNLINKDGYIYAGNLTRLLDQLDEPEVLSQKWISENVEYAYFDMLDGSERLSSATAIIRPKKLQNLLVPKQDKPVIPQFVADYLDFAKSDTTLMRVLELANTRDEWEKWEKEYDWIEENHELFARAWLDGFTVEEEQKYILSISITDKASKTNYETFLNKRGIFHSMENESFNSEEFNWTEEEIKGLENGEILFEHFAVKVEELEE